MAIVVICLVLLHAAAFGGILLLAKYSVLLVDEEGRTLGGPSPWHERVVHASRPSAVSREI